MHPNYPPKTCILPGCNEKLILRNESIVEWQRRKYCSLACAGSSRKQPIKHGTPGGANTHRRRGEEVCEPCRQAQGQYRRDRAANGSYSKTLARVQARRRAMRRLAAMYPREYGQLVARELRRELAASIERHPAGKKLKETA